MIDGTTARAAHAARIAGDILAILGFVVLVVLLVVGFQAGRFTMPGGDVLNFLDAGERLRDGEVVYVGSWDAVGTVYFAPPVIVMFAIIGLLPGWVLGSVLVALDVVGLRYLTGSWRAFGWASLCPVTAFQLASGNPNFAIVAAILLASRVHAGPLALAALAKIGPAVAVDPRRLRQFVLWGSAAIALTLPCLWLWPEWLQFLLATPTNPGWPTIIPFAWRILPIVLLLALRRPSARMLAGALAIPGFYIVTAWATLILAGRLLSDAAGGRGWTARGHRHQPPPVE